MKSRALFRLLERNTVSGKSKVRAQLVPNRKRRTLQPIIEQGVTAGSNVYTDELLAYHMMNTDYYHAFVNHAEKYVDGNVHTNGIENFWALLKRMIRGTYVSLEAFHMFRYLDEECFRFNKRFGDDTDRFITAMHAVTGKRVYQKLTGKEDVSSSGSGVADAEPAQ